MLVLYELVHGADPDETMYYTKARKAAAALARAWAMTSCGYVNVWLSSSDDTFHLIERWLMHGMGAWMSSHGVHAVQMCDAMLDEAARACICIVKEDAGGNASMPIPIPPPWPVLVKARPGCATPALKTSSAYEPLPAAVLPVLLGV